jgi:hypothetical protein
VTPGRPLIQQLYVRDRRREIQVGIWSGHLDDGEGVLQRMDSTQREWHLWADLNVIRLRRKCRRIALIGESVARGYFYDPEVTPAKVLSSMLDAYAGPDLCDVIDLARTDLSLYELPRLVIEALALAPDAIVIFAGNNWFNLRLTTSQMETLASAIQTGGYNDCRTAFYSHILLPQCTSALALIASSARATSTPVVLVIPECNQRDWRPPDALPCPILRCNANAEWYGIYDDARSAMRRGDIAEASAGTGRLRFLDQDLSAASGFLSADCNLELKRYSVARNQYRSGGDAEYGILVPRPPRCTAIIQAALRQLAKRHSFHTVDLQVTFSQFCPDEIPGRTLFLDYCHLSANGMQIAMSATSRAVVAALQLEARASIDASSESGLSVRSDARAHFLAAIHNAHYCQPLEIVTYHCLQAVTLCPEIADEIEQYASSHVGPQIPWASPQFWKLMSCETMRRHLVYRDKAASAQVTALRVLEAIRRIDALAPRVKGIKCEARWCGFASLTSTEFDLLEANNMVGCNASQRSLTRGRGFFRSYSRQEKFYFPYFGGSALSLAITLRVSSVIEHDTKVTLYINESFLTHISAPSAWKTFNLILPAEDLQAGANVLTIEWPVVEVNSQAEWTAAASSLRRGDFPDVFQVAGEIYELTAKSM